MFAALPKRARTALRLLAVAGVVLLPAGCAPPPAAPSEQARPPAFDPAGFSEGRIYEVIPGESRLIITVYRAGPMADMGHNHVISTTDIRGAVYRHDKPERSGVALKVPVKSLEVDNAELRRADPQTFDSEPGEKDIEGTRRNMLGDELLNADQYPHIRIRSVSISGDGPGYEAVLRFTVRDHQYDARLPVQLETTDERIRVSGTAGIRQSDLGLEPFSVMMGSLRVRDEMDIEFEIVAGRRGP